MKSIANKLQLQWHNVGFAKITLYNFSKNNHIVTRVYYDGPMWETSVKEKKDGHVFTKLSKIMPHCSCKIDVGKQGVVYGQKPWGYNQENLKQRPRMVGLTS